MEKYLNGLPAYAFMYPGRPGSIIPEHRNQQEMKTWLNSEPEALSFNEVWDDLEEVLDKNGHLTTRNSRTPFSAQFDRIGRKWIKIARKNGEFYLYKDHLLDLWQQIRNYGFSSSKIVPNGLGKDISYIFPIFAELQYLTIVEISDSYNGLSKNSAIGLQYLGLSKRSRSPQYDLF